MGAVLIPIISLGLFLFFPSLPPFPPSLWFSGVARVSLFFFYKSPPLLLRNWVATAKGASQHRDSSQTKWKKSISPSANTKVATRLSWFGSRSTEWHDLAVSETRHSRNQSKSIRNWIVLIFKKKLGGLTNSRLDLINNIAVFFHFWEKMNKKSDSNITRQQIPFFLKGSFLFVGVHNSRNDPTQQETESKRNDNRNHDNQMRTSLPKWPTKLSSRVNPFPRRNRIGKISSFPRIYLKKMMINKKHLAWLPFQVAVPETLKEIDWFSSFPAICVALLAQY